MDDIRVVMDAAGSERAVTVRLSEGGALSALFAATYPERASGLIVLGGFARMSHDDGLRLGARRGRRRRFNAQSARPGDNAWLLKLWAPSIADDPVAQRMEPDAGVRRHAVDRGGLAGMVEDTDVRDVLPAIRVPTLVLHRPATGRARPARPLPGRAHPGRPLVELPRQRPPPVVDGDSILDEVESFLTGAPAAPESTVSSPTVMFTDIVDSTTRAAELGDRRWRDLVEATTPRALAARALSRAARSRRWATASSRPSTGPARAIRCAARRPRRRARRSGSSCAPACTRASARSAATTSAGSRSTSARASGATAGAGEVLVSQTVKDLVAGSGLDFEDRGEHELKGVPGSWRLYSVGAG